MKKALLGFAMAVLLISCGGEASTSSKEVTAEELVQVNGSVPNVQKWIMEGLGEKIGTYEGLEWSALTETGNAESERKYVVRHRFKAQLPNTSEILTYNWLFYLGAHGQVVDKQPYQ